MPSKRRLQQYALAISVISILYNGLEGALSIAFGSESSSRSLVFFGIQSGIEVISASLVVWRFRNVAKPGEEMTSDISPAELRFEKIATLSIAALLILLGLGTEGSSIAGLVLHSEPSTSKATLIISSTALVIMILIWLPKRYLARELNSSSLEGEAKCSLSCIQITTVLLVGAIIFRFWRGGWWVDSATSIILGLLFMWEGIKMARWAMNPEFKGGCCEACRPDSKDRSTAQYDAELGMAPYHDVCECCKEKAECRDSDTCQCPSEEVPADCCKPVSEAGDKCCTRQLRSVPRSTKIDEPVMTPYHDVCDCCKEKPECREADICQCSPEEVPADCCKPVSEVGDKCCTREIRPVARSTRQIIDVQDNTTTSQPPKTQTTKGCCDDCCD